MGGRKPAQHHTWGRNIDRMIPNSRKRSGISNVISTILLTGVLLAIMITATFVSNDILNAQMVESEFENAKNLVRTLDGEVEDLLFKPGSSSVIQTSFTNIFPGYNCSGEDLSIVVEEHNPSQVIINESIEMNSLTLTGRRTIGGVYDYDLKGSSTLLAPLYNGSLGRIHISKPSKLQVSLDYTRVLYALTGKVYLINNQTGNYTLHNTMELVCVELDFGEFSSSENSVIMVQNIRGETPIAQDLDGDFTVTVSTSNRSTSASLSELGGDPSIPTVLNLYQVTIRISVLEG